MFHGFTDYMRDYELVIQLGVRVGERYQSQFFRYVFTHCVQANASTALKPSIWQASLDERLIDYDTGVDLDGYVWGVKWQEISGGIELADDSDAARSWSSALGIPFHEARVRTNGHNLDLVFSDLRIEDAPAGYAPFTTGEPFWDGKFSL